MQNEFLKTNLIGLEKKYENRKKTFIYKFLLSLSLLIIVVPRKVRVF